MNERLNRAATAARVDLAHEPDFTLGLIEVRPSLREICVQGRSDIIDRRVMQVLVTLVRAKGGVVSRDDLIESCWDGVIVADDAINTCISRLRRVAETSGNAFSIDTVPRVGYRLKTAHTTTAVPESVPAAELPSARAGSSTATPLPLPLRSAKPARNVRMSWVAAFSALLILIAAAIAASRFWATSPGPAGTPVDSSVAILPFVNMSGDPKKEYFSDGFSEELVNDLSNNQHLRVASRTSSFAFKGRNENIGLIARALNVHAVVEGSVREAGSHVRITAQLIDASDGYHLWSAAYDRNLTDILSVQGELARAISAALTHRLVPVGVTPTPKIDPAAYRLYLQGIHELHGVPQPENLHRALAIFAQVTKRAPGFADGFASLAGTALNLAVQSDSAPAADFALASDAAQRALSLDPRNMRARATRAVVELDAWNWRASASELRVLRSENPNSYFSIVGLWNFYSNIGFVDQALVVWRRLKVLEPQTYTNSFITPQTLDNAGHFQEEIGAARAIIANQPTSEMALLHLCGAYADTGQIKDARTVEQQLRVLEVDDYSKTNSQACGWVIDLATGNLVEARKLLQVWEAEFPDKGTSAGEIGQFYVALGDFDRASDWFERAYERREVDFFRNFYLRDFGAEKAFEKYRTTAGYKTLAQKPLFREWQAEHDRIAAALAAHRDPLK